MILKLLRMLYRRLFGWAQDVSPIVGLVTTEGYQNFVTSWFVIYFNEQWLAVNAITFYALCDTLDPDSDAIEFASSSPDYQKSAALADYLSAKHVTANDPRRSTLIEHWLDNINDLDALYVSSVEQERHRYQKHDDKWLTREKELA